ncbi:FtsQ-type POTRA domain-containing protein [bacterium]|jgi:cell division septal protein FtsQ|nr:FtsQ-type POTRA domain-containing protein [bacterium]MBT6293653.1 FtsQ-type POTRA domain-containing protein [bacterium]
MPKKQLKITSITIFLLLAMGFTMFTSNFFRIKNIEIYRNNIQTKSPELEKFKNILLNQNYFLFNTEKYETQIKKFTPFKDLKIKKSFPNTLEIKLKEQSIIANLKNNNKYFVVLENGQITNQDIPISKLITINYISDKNLIEDSQILNQDQLIYIKNAYFYFRKEFNQTIKEIDFLPTAKEIHLITENGTKIWIDTTIEFDSQINKLKNAQPTLDFRKKRFKYIDLRIQSFEETKQKIIYKD